MNRSHESHLGADDNPNAYYIRIREVYLEAETILSTHPIETVRDDATRVIEAFHAQNVFNLCVGNVIPEGKTSYAKVGFMDNDNPIEKTPTFFLFTLGPQERFTQDPHFLDDSLIVPNAIIAALLDGKENGEGIALEGSRAMYRQAFARLAVARQQHSHPLLNGILEGHNQISDSEIERNVQETLGKEGYIVDTTYTIFIEEADKLYREIKKACEEDIPHASLCTSIEMDEVTYQRNLQNARILFNKILSPADSDQLYAKKLYINLLANSQMRQQVYTYIQRLIRDTKRDSLTSEERAITSISEEQILDKMAEDDMQHLSDEGRHRLVAKALIEIALKVI